jgi:hypothetical protein
MNLLHANFEELYERHLCRHSQFGINVGHIICVIGTYLALFGMLYNLTDSPTLVLAVTLPYLTVMAFNLPLRVFAAVFVFLGLFFAGFFALPKLPIWLCLFIIFALYKVQNWEHRIWNVERDMTEFNKKYPKGVKLFFLLTLYELAILLNYLCFDRVGDGNPAFRLSPTREQGTIQVPDLAGASGSEQVPTPEHVEA